MSGDYMTDSYGGRYAYGAGMYASTKESGGGGGGTATWGSRHDEYGGVDKAVITSGGSSGGGGKWEGRTDMRPKTSIVFDSLKRKVSVLNPAVALAHLSNRSADRGRSRNNSTSSGNGAGGGNGVSPAGVGRSNSFGNIKTSLSGLFKSGRHSGQPSPDSYESRTVGGGMGVGVGGGSVNGYGEDVKVPVPHLYNSYKSRPSTDVAVPGSKHTLLPTIMCLSDARLLAGPLLTTGPAVPFQIPVINDPQGGDPTTALARPDAALLATTTTQQSRFPTTESIRIPLTTKPNLRDLPSPPLVPAPNQTKFPSGEGLPASTSSSNRASAVSPSTTLNANNMDFTSPSTGTVVYSHPFSTAGVYQPVKPAQSRKGSDAIVDISDIGSATHGNSFAGHSGSGYHPYAPYAADYGKQRSGNSGPFGGSSSSLHLPDSSSADGHTYSSHAPLRGDGGSEKGKTKAMYEPGRNPVEFNANKGQDSNIIRSGRRELPAIPPNAAAVNKRPAGLLGADDDRPISLSESMAMHMCSGGDGRSGGHVRSNSDASLIGRPIQPGAGAAARSEWGTYHKFPSTSSLNQAPQPHSASAQVSRNPEWTSHSRANSFSSYDRANPMMMHHSRNNSTPSISYYPNATSADGLARSYDQTVFTRPESRASSVTSKRFSNQLFSR
jgi:hypothetical protein